MLRERYRVPRASGNQAPQTSSRDQAPQISSRDEAPQITSSHGRIYYRASDLAKRYGVHVITVWRWRATGNLPEPTRLGPGTVGWRSDTIEAWETQRVTKRREYSSVNEVLK